MKTIEKRGIVWGLAQLRARPTDHHMLTAVALAALSLATGARADSGVIKKVYIVFSNHFDLGYTLNQNGSCAGAVVNEYFHKHFPAAIETAEAARKAGKFQYRWMTQSWLVSAYRHCNTTKINIGGPGLPSDVICPDAEALAAFEAAVVRGDITWHAFPFNAEPEVYTPELFDAALNLTFAEDAYFGHGPRHTLSQRDVPGLTRATLPLLNRRGVVGVSVGENTQVAPVEVPAVFLWRDNATGAEAIAMFHALGYGAKGPASGSEPRPRAALTCDERVDDGCADDPSVKFYVDKNGDTVAKASVAPWDDGPSIHVGSNGKVDPASTSHCVEVPAAGAALCYAWKLDNTGPHPYWRAEAVYDYVSARYPEAKVSASDAFDDFVSDVFPHRDSLPVVTAEIGDTWMMGANSDPLKISLFRGASRAHAACIRDGDAACLGKNASASDVEALRSFERLLMTVGEHTWGWNGGHVRRRSWSNKELQESLRTDVQFQTAVRTWREERAFLRNALEALPRASPLFRAVRSAYADIDAARGGQRINDAKFGPSRELNETISCGAFRLRFARDGSIVGLDMGSDDMESGGTSWADPMHPLARIWYANPDVAAVRAYAKDYIAGASALWPIWPGVIAEGLVKPNLDLPSINANATLASVRIRDDGSAVLLGLDMSGPAHEERGAPASFDALLECSNGAIDYTLRWYNKTATHAPETVWFSSVPEVGGGAQGTVILDKLGLGVDAADADLGGCDGHRRTCGVHLHGVGDGGALIRGPGGRAVRIISLDSSLVSVGSANGYPTPLVRPDPAGGVHYALVGNMWNTNYPFWWPFDESDKSAQFRFRLEFVQSV